MKEFIRNALRKELERAQILKDWNSKIQRISSQNWLEKTTIFRSLSPIGPKGFSNFIYDTCDHRRSMFHLFDSFVVADLVVHSNSKETKLRVWKLTTKKSW